MQLRERLQRVGGVAVYESWNRNREAVVKNSYYFNNWLLSVEKNDCENNAQKFIKRIRCSKFLRWYYDGIMIED